MDEFLKDHHPDPVALQRNAKVIRPTLSLNSKKQLPSTAVDPRQLNLTLPSQQGDESEPLYVDVSRKPKNGTTTKAIPQTVMARLCDALRCHCAVFIQLRCGVGYMGVPVELRDGWAILTNASIHGTQKSYKVTELAIQLGDCGQIAHVRSIGNDDIVTAISIEGEVAHG